MFDEAERGTRPRNVHEIGQDLSVLSVSDLDERIEALRREIARLEEDRRRKLASQEAARAAFKF
ncbi:hypothetical protein NS228_10010 [Methylobacterium indicum]|uniref:DUF1192 domain-containing protein n=1 Tax=Methylobacterium indicum TaxID=1775910 RepID=A0A8H8WV38_9HYPH|nr:DUF1192 domain-containing protein [Methylobacterium indicum]KTS24066.1 hypothetical protein NS229_22155 [Methylobacterium indicum]KTS40657.1 hypothetical protein NS228_10010 [Methylobacterium indicum]KTS45294.1 hypothetical protein NS230_24110 [Methylobacterium indicum]BCM84817.1 hypothetical protein mvi_32780 [Methylobacterium indicum]